MFAQIFSKSWKCLQKFGPNIINFWIFFNHFSNSYQHSSKILGFALNLNFFYYLLGESKKQVYLKITHFASFKHSNVCRPLLQSSTIYIYVANSLKIRFKNIGHGSSTNTLKFIIFSQFVEYTVHMICTILLYLFFSCLITHIRLSYEMGIVILYNAITQNLKTHFFVNDLL